MAAVFAAAICFSGRTASWAGLFFSDFQLQSALSTQY
jgi:hypothetical protein